jgi:hypothetical protein
MKQTHIISFIWEQIICVNSANASIHTKLQSTTLQGCENFTSSQVVCSVFRQPFHNVCYIRQLITPPRRSVKDGATGRAALLSHGEAAEDADGEEDDRAENPSTRELIIQLTNAASWAAPNDYDVVSWVAHLDCDWELLVAPLWACVDRRSPSHGLVATWTLIGIVWCTNKARRGRRAGGI